GADRTAVRPRASRTPRREQAPPERRRAALSDDPFVLIKRRRPTLPCPCEPSTIGAERLNFSVRNGKRCFPLAIATDSLRDEPLPGLQNCTAEPKSPPEGHEERGLRRRQELGKNIRQALEQL